MNKRRNKQANIKKGKRRNGKGFTYSNVTGNLRLLAIVFIGLFAFYFFRHFSLLFSDVSAIAMFGWIVISLLAFSLTGVLTLRLANTLRYLEKKHHYENTKFFSETGLPYHKVIDGHKKSFEYTVSLTLEKTYPDSPQLIDIPIGGKDSVNECFQIDCMLFHKTGIYIIGLKDYKGDVYGSKSSKYWNVCYETNGKKAIFEFRNPILQNETHIHALNAINHADYQNIVIFSKHTLIDEPIKELHTVDSLGALIESKPPIYSKDVLKTIKASIEAH